MPSHETTARRVVREIWRRRRQGEANPMLVEAVPAVCGWLAKIGAPEGGAVYALPVENMAAGEYRLSSADASHLPQGSKLLK